MDTSSLTALQTFWSNYSDAIIALATWVLAGLVLDRIIHLIASSTRTSRLPDTFRAFLIAIDGVFAWTGLIIGVASAWRHVAVQIRPDADWSKYYQAFTIFIITAFTARIIKRLITEYSRKQNTRLPSSSIFTNIASALVWIIGLGIMFVQLGVQLTPIITAFGIGGVAIGLALQPTLDNLFSGIQILASEQILPSDFVRLSTGEEGFVEDVTWRNTTVRRATGDIVIVPNSVLSKTHVVNYSRSDRPYALTVLITIPREVDYEQALYEAKLIANEVIKESPLAYKASAPLASLQEIEPTGTVLKIILPVLNYFDRDAVKTQFMTILIERYHELEIPVTKIVQV